MDTEQTRDGRRRRSSLVVTSVAAAVLLAGGGTYLLTASSDDDGGGASAGGGGTPPPLALDGYADGKGGHADSGPDRTNGTGGGASEGTEGIAPGEPDPTGATYRAVGELPKGPDSAAVYAPHGEVTRDRVTRLAKALGLSGTPVARGDAWRLGPANDGSGPSLQVTRKAPGTWTFSRHEPGGGDNCRKGRPCPDGTSLETGTPVGEAAAKKAAAPVLKAVGQDGAKLDARQLMGSVRVVNASPEVDGLPTYGWSTGVQVDGDGQVVGGSGHLVAPRKGATYPVVSAEKALALLNASGDDRVGIGGCATPAPRTPQKPGKPAVPEEAAPGPRTGAEPEDGTPGAREQAPCEPTVPPKPRPVPVVDATFGLAAHFVAGRQTLVPSWLFEVRPQGAPESSTVSHPAVDPAYLKAPGMPGDAEPEPEPEPAEPGSTVTRDVRVDGYSSSGRTLTLHFTGGVCGTYEATAEERGRRVAVKVTETGEKGRVCVKMAKFYTLPVTLEKPLDGRKVVTPGGAAVPRDKGEVRGEPAPRS
ncbi:membrane protein [Streptomyces longispororuber]|uniref:Membrane protein n=1 Tax=Streptomyces longispororuber TaxID=68230 RepID=A0A919A6L7_9ACTN|nr:hypothetical protein [Streptomyces longispororuber]GHE89472.1 membrane protein [Streptomyces longispororuber]